MPKFSAMVLGAGLGTRLRPLSDEIPKPLLPVGDRSVLQTLLLKLASQGAGPLVVNAYHHAEQIEQAVRAYGLGARVSLEEELLGTAGGVRWARPLFSAGPVVVQNGDILGVSAAPKLAEAQDGADLVLAVSPARDSRSLGSSPLGWGGVGRGTIGIGSDGQVVRLRGEVFGEEVQGADYLGLSRLSERALDELPERGCLIGDFALPWLRRGKRVGTFLADETFLDIGDPTSYFRANLQWLERNLSAPYLFRARGATLGSSVKAEWCVLCENSEVSGSGLLERVIVLPNAKARAPLRDAIVTRAGTLVPIDPKGAGFDG